MLTEKAEDHYLNNGNDQYKQDAFACIEQLRPALSANKLCYLWNNKLQLNQTTFNENQFLQNACELSAASCFFAEFPQNYIYERKQNQNKDVDFSFVSEDIRFNIEVKCFNYKNPSNEQNAPIALTILGPQLDASIYEKMAADNPYYQLERSRLLNIKDFVKNSKEKFIESEDGEQNVLMISCYDISDYIDVITCIAGNFGISFGRNKSFRMTNDGNINVNDFKIIDAIVVNNLGHLHQTCHKKNFNPYINPWRYKHSFSFGFQLHDNHKSATDDNIGLKFKKLFNLYNDRYADFCSNERLKSNQYLESFPKFIDHLRKQGGHYFL